MDSGDSGHNDVFPVEQFPDYVGGRFGHLDCDGLDANITLVRDDG